MYLCIIFEFQKYNIAGSIEHSLQNGALVQKNVTAFLGEGHYINRSIFECTHLVLERDNRDNSFLHLVDFNTAYILNWIDFIFSYLIDKHWSGGSS